MSILPFTPDESFEPETLMNMGQAYIEACRELGIKNGDDSLARSVARHVVGLVKGGLHTRTALYLMTVREFTATPP